MNRDQATQASGWLDTSERYGLVSRSLHWIMAYLLLWQFGTLIGWRLLGDGMVMRTVSQLGPGHGTVGVLVLGLVLPRTLWALLNRHRRRKPDGSWHRKLVGILHTIFYILMLAVPTLAIVRAYGSGKGYSLWGIGVVPATGEEVPWLKVPADWLHSPLAWTLAVLIAGHLVMALRPDRNNRLLTLKRMAGRVRV